MQTEQLKSYIDTELLEDYTTRLGKSVIQQMLTLYEQQAKIYLQDIEEAQLSDNKPAWQEHCHKMKGAAASIGLLKLHSQLKQVEKTAATLEEKQKIVMTLKKLNEESLSGFNTWLATK